MTVAKFHCLPQTPGLKIQVRGLFSIQCWLNSLFCATWGHNYTKIVEKAHRRQILEPTEALNSPGVDCGPRSKRLKNVSLSSWLIQQVISSGVERVLFQQNKSKTRLSVLRTLAEFFASARDLRSYPYLLQVEFRFNPRQIAVFGHPRSKRSGENPVKSLTLLCLQITSKSHRFFIKERGFIRVFVAFPRLIYSRRLRGILVRFYSNSYLPLPRSGNK